MSGAAQSFGIAALGGYVPLLRLDRKTAARELAWSGLPMPRSGTRAVADWDEDAFTMAVEAARPLCGMSAPDALRFASTSAYFTDRAQSGMALDALALPRTVRTSDAANSRRAATSALLEALLGGRDEIVTAGERRPTQAGSAAQLAFGDGAAAVRTGAGAPVRLAGYASLSHDLVDRYASREHEVSYAYEERFVRDTAVAEVLLPVVRAACENAGIASAQLAHVAVHEPVGGCWRAMGKPLGCKAANHCEVVSEKVGNLGAAHALFGLGLALDAAQAGEFVLLVGFGSGADALIFEVTGPVPGASAMRSALDEGQILASYSRFLSLTGSVELDWGMRAEFEQKAQATVLERVGRDMIGFIGGRDSTGNVQFPKSAFPVNPALGAVEAMEDVRLADLAATVVSITADRLNFSPDPPFDFGLVQFENGARVLMEMVNRPADGFRVGDRVRMRLRIKSHNCSLGFRTYFWKAAPLARPLLGDA